ncbi:unnamed protein product [Chondrus crispus]|uniref:Uncharacterized protein n=1 Tax=Chondrus crispus TaxID=2769 RepID=R7Q2B1_CHOCR|nr:unnamed protein product [Chondrus crispus]CDF32732.1 unnamed protein product [Chondrus crispus]|eukprot:XP_005712503.1 unnamed protein product [Chondrus crispus]
MEGLNGIGDDFTSGAEEELTSPTTYVESRVRQSRRFLPNKQGNIIAALEVLWRVGPKVALVVRPVPSSERAPLRKSNYRIECRLKNGKLSRAVLTGRKVELMMNNMVEVEIPLTAVKDESYMDGTDRQRRQRIIVGASKCRPKKSVGGRIVISCICKRRGRGTSGGTK